jgi:hypothetical protein
VDREPLAGFFATCEQEQSPNVVRKATVLADETLITAGMEGTPMDEVFQMVDSRAVNFKLGMGRSWFEAN